MVTFPQRQQGQANQRQKPRGGLGDGEVQISHTYPKGIVIVLIGKYQAATYSIPIRIKGNECTRCKFVINVVFVVSINGDKTILFPGGKRERRNISEPEVSGQWIRADNIRRCQKALVRFPEDPHRNST